MPDKLEPVTITRGEYEDLLDDRDWRLGMESAGVDNWVGYDHGVSAYNEIKRERSASEARTMTRGEER